MRHHSAYDHYTARGKFPQSDEKFASKCDGRNLLATASILADPLLESACQLGVRLIAQPQPGELDQRLTQPRVSQFEHALLMIDRAAFPGTGSQTCIGSDLSSIVKVPEQAFICKNIGEFGANPVESQK
ncbi:hypothetical protein QBD01_001418 [Ochrobactrum sp. 19YEA23]|nr:hypothetical protein [Ochrobactrum sp. 19YEA23]